MRLTRKLISFFWLVGIILSMCTACTSSTLKPEGALWGEWAFTGSEGGNPDFAADLSFQEDGTLTLLGRPGFQVTYVVIAPGRIKLTVDSSEVLNYSLEQDTLTLYFGDGYNTYTRALEIRPIAQGEPTETVVAVDESPMPTNTEISSDSKTYRFIVPTMEVEAYIENDGTLSLWYLIEFENNTGASPIDFVDIGMPSFDYKLNDIQAQVNGKPITQIESSPYVPNGFALALSADAIQPGESGAVTAWIRGIRNVLSVNTVPDRENYVNFQFSPTWFDPDIEKSTNTDYRVTVILPPGVAKDEGIYYEPHRWPAPVTPDDIGRTAAEGRIYYSWFSNTANAHTQYIFRVAFPLHYVRNGTTTTQPTMTAHSALGIGSMMVNPADGALMVYVPKGEFLMGSEDEDAGSDEKPQHSVYLDAFWIYQHTVTHAEYRQCVVAGGCKQPLNTYYYDDDNYHYHPAVYMSWFDAAAYCQWAGGRLPTEAEWEKAARGTDGRRYPWGNTPVTGNKSNFCDVNCQNSWADISQNDGYADTAPVGSYPAGVSPYGALDMAGNVWEWVADWYDSTYYSHSPYENPMGPNMGAFRVLRGGSWYDRGRHLTVSYRGKHDPTDPLMDYGFRCVYSP